MRLLGSYIIGLIFGIGIAISGMANPAKVINFFDIAGIWDPSLAFVMGGALIVTFVGYTYVLKRPSPVLGGTFRTGVTDVFVFVGAMLAGIGAAKVLQKRLAGRVAVA